MTSKRLGTWLALAGAALLVVLVVDSSGLVSDHTAVIVDDSAQLAAGLAAAATCLWTARRTRGPERAWRRLMGLGMAGWSVGMALWAWYQIFSDTPLPSPSWADVGFLSMPVLALPALLSLAVERPRQADDQRHASVVFLLDGLVVVGSLFVLTWATALGAVVHSVAPTREAFAVAVAYPATDLVLVVIVVLLAVTRRVPVPYRSQLWLLGSGLVAISVSDSIFAYLVSTGADEMPPVTNAGFIAGPLLIAIAAGTVADADAPAADLPASPAVERAHLLLPYALVALTGAVVAVQSATGARIDSVEASLTWVVMAAVLVRQMITLSQNTALLERVSSAQAELAHRAHHDPLTGLANRTLFGERLDEAVRAHREQGRQFALLVIDLDEFKAVNDTLGHTAGDRVLHAIGRRLCGCVRSTDTVARLGGDEFAVVLDRTAESPGLVSERILASLRAPLRVEGHSLTLSASVGVVEPAPDEHDLTPDAVLRRADGAMYVGKRQGKGVAVHHRAKGAPASPPAGPVAARPEGAPAPRGPVPSPRR